MVFVFFMCVEFAEKKVIQIFTIEKFNMIVLFCLVYYFKKLQQAVEHFYK